MNGIVIIVAIPIISFFIIVITILCCSYISKKMCPGSVENRPSEPTSADRQGNIYTISDDNALNNAGPPRFADFFYLEPGSEEATRIRAQLEKDEKELPSYDEVMRMATLPQSPLAMESGTATMGASTTSIATAATDISIPAPPYSEVDFNATFTAATAAAASSAIAGTPSTSRAAASVIVPNTITTTTSTNA